MYAFILFKFINYIILRWRIEWFLSVINTIIIIKTSKIFRKGNCSMNGLKLFAY